LGGVGAAEVANAGGPVFDLKPGRQAACQSILESCHRNRNPAALTALRFVQTAHLLEFMREF
jgi:hypothetical protein